MHIATILANEPDIAQKALRLRRDPDHRFPILSAKIKLTWLCNLRCRMCRLWREDRICGNHIRQLPPDRVRHALSELKRQGLRKVHLSGGEVFLYAHFTDIVTFARDLDLQVNLTTNGTLMTKDLARFLVEIRVHTVTVSIDSADAPTHDRIRGHKGAFKAAWNGIRLLQRRKQLKGRGPKIGINTVVTRNTINHLDALYHLLCNADIDSWRILPIDTPRKRLRPTEAQWQRLFESIEKWRHILARLPLDWSSQRSAKRAQSGKYAGVFYGDNICFAPWFNIFIDADGRMYPCCGGKQQMKPYGNINENNITQIDHALHRKEIRYSMAAGHPFPICEQCDDFLEENQAFNTLLKGKGK